MKMDVMQEYFDAIESILTEIKTTQRENIDKAATVVADRIAQDVPVFVFGPGGHSNLGTQEIFFRAGGLMHVNPILDGGTLLSNGALRSMAIERLPGYGTIVMENSGFGKDDVLILCNAYGINSATIDAALYVKSHGGKLIAVTSVEHAKNTPADHPARHPSKKNLADIADITLDCKIKVGDAVINIPGIPQPMGAMSTFANAYVLNCLMMTAAQKLVAMGIEPPLWKSGNCPGGDEWNNKYCGKFKNIVHCL